jgi:hypothetical protein
MKRIDAAERRLAEDELASPDERGSRCEPNSGKRRFHPGVLSLCQTSMVVEGRNADPFSFISMIVE